MTIYIFKMPAGYTTEKWIEVLSEVIGKSYRLLGRGIRIVKETLAEAVCEDGTLRYKDFIEQLNKEPDSEVCEKDREGKKTVAKRLTPVYVNKNIWTDVFDDVQAPGIENLSIKKLKEMIKKSNEEKFSMLVLNLWTRINLPEHYERDYC